jgi:hypothetical protein
MRRENAIDTFGNESVQFVKAADGQYVWVAIVDHLARVTIK